MADRQIREIWIHALGAKVGGGITYLRAVLPELARQLDGRVDSVVVLLPGPIDDLSIPEWLEVRSYPVPSSSWLRRTMFDQVTLPCLLGRSRHRALFCTGSFSPALSGVRTVALLRNAIYFDDRFLRLELPSRRRSFRLQGGLIRWGARRCAAVMYPTEAMRSLVENGHVSLSRRGIVNPYGVWEDCYGVRTRPARPGSDATQQRAKTFLYVMNYNLQKNVGYLLEALALARDAGIAVRVVLTSRLENGHPLSEARDQALMARHHLEESGHVVLAGPQYGDELVELYATSDACVFPSICESFGNPLVEAMAAGKPIVAADRPYARELCGDAAVYVDPEDPSSLLDVWRNWEETMQSWRPVPREFLESRFSWQSHVERVVDALLGGSPGQI